VAGDRETKRGGRGTKKHTARGAHRAKGPQGHRQQRDTETRTDKRLGDGLADGENGRTEACVQSSSRTLRAAGGEEDRSPERRVGVWCTEDEWTEGDTTRHSVAI
jgi:hypothetical protein